MVNDGNLCLLPDMVLSPQRLSRERERMLVALIDRICWKLSLLIVLCVLWRGGRCCWVQLWSVTLKHPEEIKETFQH
jgi:hypothetical protein